MGNPFLSPVIIHVLSSKKLLVQYTKVKKIMISKYKYGIIGCTSCRQVKGVNLHHMTTKCPHCGKTIKVKEHSILYETSNEQELQKMVARINEQIQKH